jgi:hypothetical protein
MQSETRPDKGWKSSAKLLEHGNVICIAAVIADPAAAAWGILPSEPSLTNELFEERKRDKARE